MTTVTRRTEVEATMNGYFEPLAIEVTGLRGEVTTVILLN